MAVTIQGNVNSTIYGKGDICLKLNPFDNFRLFTLYENWKSDDRTPLDLSNGQKVYLIFKSKNKEIRIPEYDLVDSDYTVDKVNGQVLFKISKKNSIDILSMDSNVFYITRVYETTDYTGEKVVSSDEEVLYTGRWKDESENSVDNYTAQLKAATDILDDRNQQIKDLMESNAKLMAQNAELAQSLSTLQDENDKLEKNISDLEAKVTDYESGTEYTGTVIGEGTYHTIVTGVSSDGTNYTEEQLQEALKMYEETIKS